jgi:23S rRNA (adenine-N6)-dimethyltransferase
MSQCEQQANRQYSQNRLRRRLLRRLLARSSIDKGDLVYDIGAGDGVITLELVERGARVIAIEKDKNLYSKLNRKIGNSTHVKVRNADFLAELLPHHTVYKVFANIPFMCTSSIIRKLFFCPNPPVDSYLVLQREAAERFAGTYRECLLSLLLKPRFGFSIIYTFRPDDFFPVPGVEIVLLRIEKRRQALVYPQHKDRYREFISYGLRCGKRTIKIALKGLFSYTQFGRLSRDLDFPPKVTPTELSFRQWLGLFNFLMTRPISGCSKQKFLR